MLLSSLLLSGDRSSLSLTKKRVTTVLTIVTLSLLSTVTCDHTSDDDLITLLSRRDRSAFQPPTVISYQRSTIRNASNYGYGNEQKGTKKIPVGVQSEGVGPPIVVSRSPPLQSIKMKSKIKLNNNHQSSSNSGLSPYATAAKTSSIPRPRRIITPKDLKTAAFTSISSETNDDNGTTQSVYDGDVTSRSSRSSPHEDKVLSSEPFSDSDDNYETTIRNDLPGKPLDEAAVIQARNKLWNTRRTSNTGRHDTFGAPIIEDMSHRRNGMWSRQNDGIQEDITSFKTRPDDAVTIDTPNIWEKQSSVPLISNPRNIPLNDHQDYENYEGEIDYYSNSFSPVNYNLNYNEETDSLSIPIISPSESGNPQVGNPDNEHSMFKKGSVIEEVLQITNKTYPQLLDIMKKKKVTKEILQLYIQNMATTDDVIALMNRSDIVGDDGRDIYPINSKNLNTGIDDYIFIDEIDDNFEDKTNFLKTEETIVLNKQTNKKSNDNIISSKIKDINNKKQIDPKKNKKMHALQENEELDVLYKLKGFNIYNDNDNDDDDYDEIEPTLQPEISTEENFQTVAPMNNGNDSTASIHFIYVKEKPKIYEDTWLEEDTTWTDNIEFPHTPFYPRRPIDNTAHKNWLNNDVQHNVLIEGSVDGYIVHVKGILVVISVLGALALMTFIILIAYTVVKCRKKPIVNNYQVNEQKLAVGLSC